MTREPIYKKLFEVLAMASGAVTCSRRLRHWTDVAADEQPALFMTVGQQVAIRQKGLPTKWHIVCNVYLYARTDEPNETPATIINNMLDNIEKALEPGAPGETQTLGLAGVSHCWIEGDIETDEGTLGEQAMAIIPVNILTV